MPIGHTFYHRDPPLNGETALAFHQRMGRIHHDLIDACLWHKVWGWNMQNMPMPALPRPPQPNAAAIRVLIEAELAAQWAKMRLGPKPCDAPGSSMMERAWKRMLAQDREMMALIYPPQPTPTKAEP